MLKLPMATFIALLGLLFSALLTALMRGYLVRRNLLDTPNARSSHSVPTPRGGGVGIVVVFLLAIHFLALRGGMSQNLSSAIIGGGLAVAIVGLFDDYFQISVPFRLLIHLAAASWALWRLKWLGPANMGQINWEWGWVVQLLAIPGLIWMTNLYNFMDGIDGLAGMEAVCTGGSGSLLMMWTGIRGLPEGSMALAAASAGFLVWNWPPAKIFMGDVGSGFLGFVFGLFALSSYRERPSLLWIWLILLSVFVVDSTLTLIRRLLRGERWYEAHCTHAYQHAARRHGLHSKVTLAVVAINAAWLFPLAWLASIRADRAPLIAVAAVVPLICAAFHYKAGQNTKSLEMAHVSRPKVRAASTQN